MNQPARRFARAALVLAVVASSGRGGATPAPIKALKRLPSLPAGVPCRHEQCHAYGVDLDKDGKRDVVLYGQDAGARSVTGFLAVYLRKGTKLVAQPFDATGEANDGWRKIGVAARVVNGLRVICAESYARVCFGWNGRCWSTDALLPPLKLVAGKSIGPVKLGMNKRAVAKINEARVTATYARGRVVQLTVKKAIPTDVGVKVGAKLAAVKRALPRGVQRCFVATESMKSAVSPWTPAADCRNLYAAWIVRARGVAFVELVRHIGGFPRYCSDPVGSYAIVFEPRRKVRFGPRRRIRRQRCPRRRPAVPRGRGAR